MWSHGKISLFSFAAAGCLLLGCTSTSLPTTADETEIVRHAAKECAVGCWDVDSFPEEPGEFVNYSVNPDQCFTPFDWPDVDEDGITEFCENWIAEKFAPVIYFVAGDDITGEPRFAVKRGGSGNEVEILYMTSMYHDFGSSSSLCNFFPISACNGHHGDSEVIHVVIDYEPSTYHWLLVSADYSQHTSYGNYSYTDITYPGRDRGRPGVWAALSKHALYKSAGECNSGGPLGLDTCSGTLDSLVLRAAPVDNVGSSITNFMDCVGSYSFYSGTECYWTPTGKFGGWQGSSTSNATEDNSSRLGYWGF